MSKKSSRPPAKSGASNENRVVYSSETGRVCPDCGKPATACICGPLRALGRKLGSPTSAVDAAGPSKASTGTDKPIATTSADGLPTGDRVRVSKDRSGRGGKTVTTVSGLSGTLEVMEEFSRTLRKAMGSGGTLKEGRIEVQGDHVERVLEWLAAKGIKAKRSGG